MAARRSRWCRILGTVVLVLPALGCSLAASTPTEEALLEGPPPSVPPTPVEATLVRDVVREQSGVMVASQPELLMAKSGSSALVAFTLPPLDADCVATAELRVHAELVETRVEARVSIETDLPSLPDGTSLGSAVISTDSPSATGHLEGGTLTWDVTELVRWDRRHQDPADPFVVVLKPNLRSGGYGPVRLGASEGGRPPVLVLTGDPACPPA